MRKTGMLSQVPRRDALATVHGSVCGLTAAKSRRHEGIRKAAL
jgi:hypothetical protein